MTYWPLQHIGHKLDNTSVTITFLIAGIAVGLELWCMIFVIVSFVHAHEFMYLHAHAYACACESVQAGGRAGGRAGGWVGGQGKAGRQALRRAG